MGWWLAGDADAARFQRQQNGWIKRFDPRFWTVNFPRPMMAAVTTTAPDALRVDAVFYRTNDLAGLIWAAADTIDHPLLRYETARDFRACTLAFRWRSAGVIALDAINGPTLTIEGRDATGAARSWYVRLWNYANGTPEDAAIALDFAAIDGGFLLPGEADPVWAGDVDRMFISLVPPGYGGAEAPLPAPIEGWAELTGIRCDGGGSTLAIGNALVPPHGLAIATGYDDGYNQTPARILRQIVGLGYRGAIDHYVGMSHYFRLAFDAGSGLYLVSRTGGALNVAAAAWHRDFLARAGGLGFEVILSLSYELLDQHCWADWKQRGPDGVEALTGWSPPSTLLSPASVPAMAYLGAVAQAFATLAAAAGRVRFQIGEPWWWVRADGTICLHDAAARAALGADVDGVTTVRGTLPDAAKAVLDAAGALLAASTAGLAAAVRGVAADAELLILIYLPSVLAADSPEAVRANLPLGWASPAFDRLQLEDYDWVLAGDTGASLRGAATTQARLGYGPQSQDYFSGFVLNYADAAADWPRVVQAIGVARGRGVGRVFLWALPQIARDGFTYFTVGEDNVQAFDDVDFPLALGREASVTPAFSTQIVTTAAGVEQRNADWADARLSFDAGPGVRSEADIATLIAFFRARRGAARAFRFRDPFDFSSGGATPLPVDQLLAVGDGQTTGFPLVKRYGAGDAAQVRTIAHPVAGSVRVAVGGVERLSGWSLLPGGLIAFDRAPAAGASVTAGFLFDVPVRFAEDSLEVSRATFLAGEAPRVPLIEVRGGMTAPAWLAPALTTMALCWRLDRRDGVTIGFTAHDHDLRIGGILYLASPGMVPSAIRQSDGFDVDTLDLQGALTNAAITADDLAAGRWDGATLSLFAADWSDPAAATLGLARGEIGDVAIRDGAFTAELRGATALLERPVVEQTAPDCRATLGDRRCRVDLASRNRVVRVAAADGAVLTLDTPEPTPGAYAYGRLRWLDGASAGLAAPIAASDGAGVTLRDPPAFAVAPGALVELVEGCDRRFVTCRTRFANAANFRGEPYLPGNDLLTRYGTD